MGVRGKLANEGSQNSEFFCGSGRGIFFGFGGRVSILWPILWIFGAISILIVFVKNQRRSLPDHNSADTDTATL
jgi:tryptophan-rich sensory protein